MESLYSGQRSEPAGQPDIDQGMETKKEKERYFCAVHRKRKDSSRLFVGKPIHNLFQVPKNRPHISFQSRTDIDQPGGFESCGHCFYRDSHLLYAEKRFLITRHNICTFINVYIC